MKIIKPSHEIMMHNGNPYKHIERVGRICYRSEHLITETSAESFCARMFNHKHHAMIEHFRFIIAIDECDYDYLIATGHGKYITFTNDDRCVISVSARGIHDMYEAIDKDIYCKHMDAISMEIANHTKKVIENIVHLIIREYGCSKIFAEHFNSTYNEAEDIKNVRIIKDFSELSKYEYDKHAWYSIHFVCDRGVSHEMVRHRDASFAQESTRYCNYSNDKFGNEITVIKPMFFTEDSVEYMLWRTTCRCAEDAYNALTKLGVSPQQARSILPNSLKTEIVITAQVYEWKHMFNLRVLGTTGAPHPQIKEVMEPAHKEMLQKGYIV